jgi:alanyl-tRNA synthetase
MLGNFSFGDYFKKEAIAWSTEFLFDVLKLDRSRIRVTIYEDDQEAYDFWRANGMPHERITRLGQKTNYWPANAMVEQSQGPCGPCSEIFFDLQPHLPFDQDWDGEGTRWLEIWNNVFTQYTGQGTGDDYKLIELPKKNIDTGMGLERTAAAINNLAGPFETDLLRPVITVMEQLSGKSYTSTPDSPTDIAFRRIADHVRATTFLLGDGVTPSSSAQGYTLRRLMRRAIVAGIRHLGFEEETFLDRAVPGVIQNMKDYYPELVDRQEAILEAVKLEESSFRNTLKNGLARLEDALAKGVLSGEEAFDLYSTYGLPCEVTAEVALERGVVVNREGYDAAQKKHAEDSKDKDKQTWVLTDEGTKELLRSLPHTKFVGYDKFDEAITAKVLGILVDGKPVSVLERDQEAEIILDQTTFYAESGGQVSDEGELIFSEGASFAVEGVQKRENIWFHRGMVQGDDYLSVGETIVLSVNKWSRLNTMRNHTATHLLHMALRDKLGKHVAQKGSLVDDARLRFDFSHNAAVTPGELASIEERINRLIWKGLPVLMEEKPKAEAENMGAMMLFGEKYGDVVRVVSIGNGISIEFCGGTHVSNTNEIGLFKIVSEGSAAAGVRRIEAVTGEGALTYLNWNLMILNHTGNLLSTKPELVPSAVERLQTQLKELQHELKSLKSAAAGSLADTLLAEATEKDGYKVVIASVETDDVSKLADELVGRIGAGVVVLGAVSGEKLVFVAKATKDTVAKGVHCGNLVKAAAQASGGGGGGRPDFAQAGGRDASKLSEALEAARATLG